MNEWKWQLCEVMGVLIVVMSQCTHIKSSWCTPQICIISVCQLHLIKAGGIK